MRNGSNRYFLNEVNQVPTSTPEVSELTGDTQIKITIMYQQTITKMANTKEQTILIVDEEKLGCPQTACWNVKCHNWMGNDLSISDIKLSTQLSSESAV